jgi:hypothetical protein
MKAWKPFLAQIGMVMAEANIEVENDVIVILKLTKKAREALSESSKK